MEHARLRKPSVSQGKGTLPGDRAGVSGCGGEVCATNALSLAPEICQDCPGSPVMLTFIHSLKKRAEPVISSACRGRI
jgi:hypothetical protein